MKVKKIKIENFRGILDAELEFDDRLNVFIGGNGAGKTTVLDAIAQSLYLMLNNSGLIRNGEQNLVASHKDVNLLKKHFLVESEIYFNIIDKNLISILESNSNGSIKAKFGSEQTRILRKSFDKKIRNTELTIPIFKYYPANRSKRLSYQQRTSGFQISKIPQLETYNNIYHKELSYSFFLRWFFDNENKELRLKRDKGNINIESRELKSVRYAIRKAFSIISNLDLNIKSDQIKLRNSNELIPTLILENKHKGIEEDVNIKSDGEKAIITLVADIAYNLSIAKDFSESDDYLNSSGIVLIDEIEAHLHPEWQRKIIPLLTELFPNIQFFITTHSPQVISTVDSQNIFIGENFNFSKITFKSKGLDSNQILKYVFNATERPREYIDLIEKFDQIIDNQGSIEDLEKIVVQIDELDNSDNGRDIDMLIDELKLRMEAYKFDLAHETHS